MSNFETLPQLLQHTANSYHNPKYLSDFVNGEWLAVSTEEFISKVRNLAVALSEAGLKPGDCFGIYAPSSSRWLMLDFAVLSIGAITVPIFANIAPSGLEHIIKDTEMKMLYVDGDEPFSSLRAHLKKFSLIAYSNLSAPTDKLIELKELEKKGIVASEKDPGFYAKLMQQVTPQDLATIIYTSGSTGLPKGVEITHKNLVSQVEGTKAKFQIHAGQDVAISCLPLAHIFEKIVSYFYLSQGVSVYFADDVKNLGALLPTVRPTLMTVVPRILEKLQLSILTKAKESGGLKRFIGVRALNRAVARSATQKKSFLDSIYDSLVYSKIRAKLGGRLRCVISGGSALPKDLCHFFWNVGLPVYQGYGMTECSPVVSTNCEGANKFGSVGQLYPEIEVRISEIGEILVRGPNVMRGYHKLPTETKDVIDSDGWYHSGDKGQLDEEGYLFITGRIKELFKSSTGKYVSPVMIEQELTKHPLIDIAFVIGENRKFVSAILFPDLVQLAKLKARLQMQGVSDEEFILKDEFLTKINVAVDELNKNINHWENVRKFQVVLGSPTIENEGLTPTMKLKRHVLLDRYKSNIDEMYKE